MCGRRRGEQRNPEVCSEVVGGGAGGRGGGGGRATTDLEKRVSRDGNVCMVARTEDTTESTSRPVLTALSTMCRTCAYARTWRSTQTGSGTQQQQQQQQREFAHTCAGMAAASVAPAATYVC